MKIDLSNLRIFVVVFVFVYIKINLTPRQLSVLSWVNQHKKGRSYDLRSKKIIISCDVMFDETLFPSLTNLVETISSGRASLIIYLCLISRDTASSSECTTSNSEGTTSRSVQTEPINPYTLPSLVGPQIQVEHGIPPPKFKDYVNCATRYPVEMYITYANVSRSHIPFVSQISNFCEPSSFQESNSQLIWQNAIERRT